MAPKGPAENSRTLQLTSGFSYPSKRDNLSDKHADEWMKGFANDTGVPQYWRVHDKLYDLKEFTDKHPGGSFWIQSTKGSDVTELFESYHVTRKPELILQKYFVRNAETPRKSPYTFKENGFYRTLKRRVMKRMEGIKNEPTFHMCFIQDSLFFGFLFTFFLFGYLQSYVGMVLSGILLTLATIAAHNFFHQKDNWRMYIFDFGSQSSEEWRISHGISHHMFPNTIYDLELSLFAPFIEFLPVYKFFSSGWFKYVIVFVIWSVGFLMTYFVKILKAAFGIVNRRWTYMILPIQYIVLCAMTGSFQQAAGLWFTLQYTYSLLFLYIGLTGAHHAPGCCIEGDKMISDKDWGLYQIAATCDRRVTMDSLFLASVAFGNHTCHHLFPAIDHSLLPLLRDDFILTCKEFGVQFEFVTVWEALKGFLDRISNTQINTEISPKLKGLKKCN